MISLLRPRMGGIQQTLANVAKNFLTLISNDPVFKIHFKSSY